jgi:hypothetical protein
MTEKSKTDTEKAGKPAVSPAEERRARQAAALRDNLRRRKQQARALSTPTDDKTDKHR